MCKFYIKPFLTNKSKVFKVVLKTEVIMNKKVPVWALFSLGRILSLFINLKQFSTDTGGAPFSYFFARINWKYRKQA